MGKGIEIEYQNFNYSGLPGACSTCFTWHEDIQKLALCCRDKRCHTVIEIPGGKKVICNRDKTAHEHLDTECCGKKLHKFKTKP